MRDFRFGAWRVLVVSVAVLGLSSGAVSAQQVYKSINAQGEVEYSSEPPARASNIEQVELQPGPTQQQVKEARQAGERITQSANEMQSQRLAREQLQSNKRQKAEAVAAEAQQSEQAVEQVKKDETLKEYYGYRDYTFPTPVVPGGGKATTVAPSKR